MLTSRLVTALRRQARPSSTTDPRGGAPARKGAPTVAPPSEGSAACGRAPTPAQGGRFRARTAARSRTAATAATVAAAALFAGPIAAAAAPLPELLPGIAFTWTAPDSDGVLGFQLRHPPAADDPVVGVDAGGRGLTVARFELGAQGRRLDVQVRAASTGVVEVPWLHLTTRYGPPRRLRTGAAEVVALPRAGGPLRLARWVSDDALGLYAAFALVNDGPSAVTVRTLRYAPARSRFGLVLVARGRPSDFDGWYNAVLDRMAPAFAAYLEGHGRDPGLARTPPRPPALAFPLTGPLDGALWTAPDRLEVRLEPSEAIFTALTPAAFATYVDDLPIVASPVVGFAREPGASCCQLQGVPATLDHRPRIGNAAAGTGASPAPLRSARQRSRSAAAGASP